MYVGFCSGSYQSRGAGVFLWEQNNLTILFFKWGRIYVYNNLNEMKFTHNAVTSIMVEKVENITTSMTRAGLGDDTYRRQRQKQRYLKYKQQQAEKQEKMREDFFNKRNEKIKESQQLTEKRHAKRQKKKQRQRQLKKKMKFIKKLDKGNNDKEQDSQSDSEEDKSNHSEDLQEKQENHEAQQMPAQKQVEKIQVQENDA